MSTAEFIALARSAPLVYVPSGIVILRCSVTLPEAEDASGWV